MDRELMWMSIVGLSLINFGLRGAPFVLPHRWMKLPFVRFLGRFLPAAIMTVLVAFCLKEETEKALPNIQPFLIAGGLVVLLHITVRNVLLSIAAGTICFIWLGSFS